MFGHSIEYVAILVALDSIIRKISVFIIIIFSQNNLWVKGYCCPQLKAKETLEYKNHLHLSHTKDTYE